jgi:hypothetical protein
MAKILLENAGENEARVSIEGSPKDMADLLLTAMHTENSFVTAVFAAVSQYIDDTDKQTTIKTNYHA